MLFQLEQGQTAEQIILECENRGIELPQKLQNAPELWLGLGIYWEAFLRLSSGRQASGFGVGPISWIQIEEYCDRQRVSNDQRLIFHHHISCLDRAYLDFKAREAKAKAKANQSSHRRK